MGVTTMRFHFLHRQTLCFALCLGLLLGGHVLGAPSPRPLTARDLAGKSATELSLLRNEIYARHGYIFERKSVDAYFRAQPWYRPVTHDFDAMLKALPPQERDNVNLLSSAIKGRPLSTPMSPPRPRPAPVRAQTPAPARTPARAVAPKTPKRQTALDRALIAAVRGGEVATVKSLLQQGADPNTRDRDALGPEQATPLLLAARSGNGVIGELLLKAGGDATARGPQGAAPVTEAVKFGHPALVKLLLEWGAKDDARDAFREAAARGDADSLNVLLAHGGTVRKTDLIEALARGGFAPATVTILLAHGADVNARDAHGATPLMYAAAQVGPEAATFLLAHGADIKAADKDGWTTLHYAAFAPPRGPQGVGSRNPATASLLVAAGANVNARDKKLTTPLICLAEGVSPDADAEDRVTGFAKVLITHGAKINAKDQDGRTALMASATTLSADGKVFCDPALAKTLAALGADVNLRDNQGNTALIRLAVASGDEKRAISFARTLLAQGALPGARNDAGDTAAALARKYGMADLAKLLDEGNRRGRG